MLLLDSNRETVRVSLFNRFEITNKQLQELVAKSRKYFRANALFPPSSVNPTVWTLWQIVPAHAKEVFQKDGQGLCTVTNWRAGRLSILF